MTTGIVIVGEIILPPSLPTTPPIYERSLLRAGSRITGPALVFEYSASTAIPPGCVCTVDAFGNLIITMRHPRYFGSTGMAAG